MRGAASALLLALLAACGSAKTETYTLSAIPPPSRPAGPPVRPPLEVGEVAIPPTIDRNEIVLIAPGDRLDIQGTSVWGAPIGQLVRRALSDDLTERLPAGSVLPAGTPAPSSGLRIVSVAIQHFAGDSSGKVVLDADWMVTRAGQNPTGLPNSEHIEVNAGAATPQAVVPAMSQAIAELSSRIARAFR